MDMGSKIIVFTRIIAKTQKRRRLWAVFLSKLVSPKSCINYGPRRLLTFLSQMQRFIGDRTCSGNAIIYKKSSMPAIILTRDQRQINNH